MFGVSSVYAAVFAGRRNLHTLYVQESADMSKRKDDRAFKAIIEGATRAGATVQEVEKHTLNLLTDSRTHQGLVLDADPLAFVDIKVLPVSSGGGPGAPAPVWVALDEVSDPQNFGAILRSALFLGATGAPSLETLRASEGIKRRGHSKHCVVAAPAAPAMSIASRAFNLCGCPAPVSSLTSPQR